MLQKYNQKIWKKKEKTSKLANQPTI
jgi:hypothetical protein